MAVRLGHRHDDADGAEEGEVHEEDDEGNEEEQPYHTEQPEVIFDRKEDE